MYEATIRLPARIFPLDEYHEYLLVIVFAETTEHDS